VRARETLSREEIVDAAVRVLDTDGLDALSMRRLGQELGAGATSLYWHVRNKDELLDLVLDRLVGEIVDEVSLAAPADWRVVAGDVARAFRRVLVRHRHITPLLGVRQAVGPNALRGLDMLVGRLSATGFTPGEAFIAGNAVINWAAGFAVFECRSPLGPGATAEEQARYGREYDAFLGALPPDRYPMMSQLGSLMASVTADAQFEYGLARLLDGIEVHRSRSTPATADARLRSPSGSRPVRPDRARPG
jgi:AcrR family transcriptional regulator